MTPVFGFVGFGEIAAVFSAALSEHGARVYATDVLLSEPGGEDLIRSRMKVDTVSLVPVEELVAKCDLILSTVTTQVARQVAETVGPSMRPEQIYLDLNSTSPAIKVAIGESIGRSPGDFVEGAVLGAVGATGAGTRILVAGERGEGTASLLTRFGLNVSFYSPSVGNASMFKMLRSIFSKGLECLIIEFLVAARRAGLEKDLWDDITSFMAKKPFDVIADNWTRSHGAAYERRYHEMLQVMETMEEIGVSPIMTSATTALFERSVSLDLGAKLQGEQRLRNAVIAALEKADHRPAEES